MMFRHQNAQETLHALQFQHVPGQLVNLLRVAVEDSLDVGIRQVAVITFKNAVKKDWNPLGAPLTLVIHLPHVPCMASICISATIQGRVLSATELHTETALPSSVLGGMLNT